MKLEVILDNGTRIEIKESILRHIDTDGKILYNTTTIKCFFLMGVPEREKVAKWIKGVIPKTDEQKEFVVRVYKALSLIDYDYQIATIEPSFDENGNIFYKEGNKVAIGITLYDWKERATKFYNDGKWHSELAILEEGDLFKAYRIAMGYWTLEYICDDSFSEGNYWNAPNSAHTLEVSGAREVGGFKDGIGNSYEIYQAESGFDVVGGYYYGDYPVTDVLRGYNSSGVIIDGSGVIVLKRTTHLK